MGSVNLNSKEALDVKRKVHNSPQKYFKGDSIPFFEKVEEILSNFRSGLFNSTQVDEYYNFPRFHQMDFGGEFYENVLLFEFLKVCLNDIKHKKYSVVTAPSNADDGIDLYFDLLLEDLNREIGINKDRIEFHEKLDYYESIHDLGQLREELENIGSVEEKIQCVNEFILDLEEDFPALEFLRATTLRDAKILERKLLAEKMEILTQDILNVKDVLPESDFQISVPAKLILFHQLGFLDALMKIPEIGGSVNAVAFYVARILDQNPTTIQSYLNKVVGGKRIDKSGSPYLSKKAVDDAKKVLGKYHIQFKEKEEE